MARLLTALAFATPGCAVHSWEAQPARTPAEGLRAGDVIRAVRAAESVTLEVAGVSPPHRLVVDTGIHAQGWTREQAIDYMVDTAGMARSDATSEVERYMAEPGQACPYKVGQLKILELRERARAELGAKFSLKDFHAVVLENGAVPLTVLEPLVDEWIAKVKAQA